VNHSFTHPVIPFEPISQLHGRALLIGAGA
jgi:hypothetical protein